MPKAGGGCTNGRGGGVVVVCGTWPVTSRREARNPKHRSVPGTAKKINSAPAKTSFSKRHGEEDPPPFTEAERK